MIEFHSEQDFQNWLSDQPKEVSAILALRMALRVLPLLDGEIYTQYINGDKFILALFRTIAISTIGSFGYNRDAALNDINAAIFGMSEADINLRGHEGMFSGHLNTTRGPLYANNPVINSAHQSQKVALKNAIKIRDILLHAVAQAAQTITGSDQFHAAELSAKVANHASLAAVIADLSENPDIWKTISLDADCIEKGITAEELSRLSLRHLQDPYSIAAELSWLNLKKMLLKLNPNWLFWLDWYDDLLLGGLYSNSYEEALITLTRKDWEKPPEEVNAQLMALKAEFEENEPNKNLSDQMPPPTLGDIPDQDLQGVIIVERQDRVFDFSNEILSVDFLSDPAVKSLLPELQKALSNAIEKSRQNNLAKVKLERSLIEFRAFLTENAASLNLEDVQVLFWAKGIALRGVLSDEKTAAINKDPEQPWLEPEFIRPVEVVVQFFNVLNGKTKRGDELDQNSRNPEPDERARDASELIDKISQMLRECPEIFARGLPDFLDDLGEISDNNDSINNGTEGVRKKTTENLLIVIAKKIITLLSAGIAVAQAAQHLSKINIFLAKAHFEILAFLEFTSTKLKQIYQYILNFFGS